MNRRDMLQITSLLLGYTVSGSLAGAILSGCRAQGGKVFKPKYLQIAQGALVAAFAERILPTTDTPGASEVGVPKFIDEFYGLHMDSNEQKAFTDALAAFETDCQKKYGKPFVQLSADAQDALIAATAQAQEKIDYSLFFKMKELTISGYLTSEEGCKALLTHVPVPGKYQGCITLAKAGGRAFSFD